MNHVHKGTGTLCWVKERLHIMSHIYRCVCILFMGIIIVVGFSSCEYSYSYIFNVKNLTNEDVVITTKMIIPVYTVQIENFDTKRTMDSVYNQYYKNVSDTVFRLPPHTEFSAITGWTSRSDNELADTPEGNNVIPAWKFVKSIKWADHIISPSIWNSASKWSIQKSERSIYMRKYVLTLQDEIEN